MKTTVTQGKNSGKRAPRTPSLYGIFVLRYDYVVYHLSLDDKIALCGRDIGYADYTGETDSADDTQQIPGRCCKLCQRNAHKELREES